MSIVGLLVALIVIGLVFWAVRAIAGAFAIPPPIITIVYIVYVVLVFIVVFWLLQSFGLVSGGPILRLR